ncbi:AraC family transcriptional regulator [Paenibacillus daejeonensis]|uniref:AraC family transcriptional regulator n=1 Tax=Paenibacillus daejeonensis TaxID=135193 RepID=UPI00035EB908|nr:AraC family transcriptional regulator [Paenibacillus daejeonensis]
MGKWRDYWAQLLTSGMRQYRNRLAMVLLLASLPGLAIGFFIYWVIESQVEHELQHIHTSQLERAANTFENQFANMEMFISHWSYDANFHDQLADLDLATGYEQVHTLYRTLLSIKGSNPMFHQVELYVGGEQPIVFTESGYKQLEDLEQINLYEGLLTHRRAMHWSNEFPGLLNYGNSRPHTLSLVHKLTDSQHPAAPAFGSLIIYLDRERVLDQIKTLTPYHQGTTFLYSENGRFLLTTTPDNQPSELDRKIFATMPEHRGETGTSLFEDSQSGETYSVTYGRFSRLGDQWSYVSAAPITAITAPVVFVSKLIIAMSIGLVLMALALAWFASARLYSPVERLMKAMNVQGRGSGPADDEFALIESGWNDLSRESGILQKKLDQHLPHLREGFLLQLLQGNLYAFREQELEERMSQYGWEVEARRYRIMMIRLTGFSRLEGRFSQGDEGLVTFAASNIIHELAEQSELEADIVNFHDLTIGLLCRLPAEWDEDTAEERVERLTREMTSAIAEVLRLHATIALSRVGSALKQIPALYEETKLALGFRDLQDGSQVIDLEQRDGAGETGGLGYPFELEKEIIYAIRLGNEDEAVTRIHEFAGEIQARAPHEAALKQGMLQLLGAVLHVVLQSGLHTHQLYEGVNLYEQLAQLREPEEMTVWFQDKVVRPFMQQWAQQKDHQVREAVERAIIIVQERFREDISLDYCADEVKMSPSAFSKAFKRITGLNFIDYLTQLRLERAKQSLRDTDKKISDVAEEVGYQHSYFNRLFKKNEGLTPSQYRQKSREEPGGLPRDEEEQDG